MCKENPSSQRCSEFSENWLKKEKRGKTLKLSNKMPKYFFMQLRELGKSHTFI